MLTGVLEEMEKEKLVLVKTILDNVGKLNSPKSYHEDLQGCISPATLSWNAINNITKKMYDGNVSHLGVSKDTRECNKILSPLENQFIKGNYSFMCNFHKIFKSLNVDYDKKDDSKVYLIDNIERCKNEIVTSISNILNKPIKKNVLNRSKLEDFFSPKKNESFDITPGWGNDEGHKESKFFRDDE
ncbi:MAG: hypothetical protein GON13_00165 [Nanoarchaeota archaeon]|nr:hypothetical protein [Nanoarchaeota archaeon]